MEKQKTVVLGHDILPGFNFLATENGKILYQNLMTFLSIKINPQGRLLLALKQFLEQKFEKVDIFTTFQEDEILSNGTLLGLIGNIIRSEVDVGVKTYTIPEDNTLGLDFSYPYEIKGYTFITEPPEYVPHIFAIFQTFNESVWLTLATFFIAFGIIYYFILKRKFHLGHVLMHVFAILMKQSALLIPASLAEKILLYSWVIGAMILCLSYESVILSFLSFPPVTKIKHLSDLSSAIRKDEIHCISLHSHAMHASLMNTNQEDLKAIANDILETSTRLGPLIRSFLQGEKRTNLALLMATTHAEIFGENNFFVSEDRFFMKITGMPMKKDFCCKKTIDAFVHRIVESGIYQKYFEEYRFEESRRVKYLTNEVPERKMTLTDVAPAFIFLLCGFLIALVAFAYEIVSNQKNLRQLNLTKMKNRNKEYNENSV